MRNGPRHRGVLCAARLFAVATLWIMAASPAVIADAPDTSPQPSKPVSFYRDVLPIFRAHCQGCHQPAKARGKYSMTDFASLLKGGDTGDAAVVPGNPDESFLIDQITPLNGKAEMPRDAAPLSDPQIELIRRWIAAGATDDTPADARRTFNADSPPLYTRPPVITSIDYSPDGSLIAVAGFHEVLLCDGRSGQLLSRLIGLSERIESVRFSPDGARLAVAGGLPGRLGEVQVWDVAERKLLLSQPVTFDTLYGAAWSPDGKLIAIGCSDNTVRAIDAETGEQELFMGTHADWPHGTVFSADGSHLVSIDRAGEAKLTEVATERFVDNITSITPGALKGGMISVARHPSRDEVVIGGSDGTPRIYRMHRLTKRVIGDDANLIRVLPSLTGRVFAVAVSRDGSKITAASALDGRSQVKVYAYDFDTTLSDELKAAQEKEVYARSAEQRKKLDEYQNGAVTTLASLDINDAAIYAAAFDPAGERLAIAGSDGTVRIIEVSGASISSTFSPAPLSQVAADASTAEHRTLTASTEETIERESLPDGTQVVGLEVTPNIIALGGPQRYTQLLITARLSNGQRLDVTRAADLSIDSPVASVSGRGAVEPLSDGHARLTISLAGSTTHIPVIVSGMNRRESISYIRDVTPLLSRVGCNAGTCHGSAAGKNGFKLSLRGYDWLYDVRSLTDDMASRRVNLASPADSLMLLKATAQVPHEGGQVFTVGDPYHTVVRQWIAEGAKLDADSAKVVSISLAPADPVVERIGSRQQMRVVARYSDGSSRDVTREAFIETGNAEVATAERPGLLTAIRRGEAAVLARYEGAYAAATLTVMGDRDGFAWAEPESWSEIDTLVAEKWRRMKIAPSDLADDNEFLRRVYLDLTGLPPTADEVLAFTADSRPTRQKRDELIDRLIGSDAFIEHWTNRWADLLQVNRKFLGEEGAASLRAWIRDQVAGNTPYDQFAREIVTASGSNKRNPPAGYYKTLREPAELLENTTHLFLAVRFNCNKCHDHPFERWTQDQYYQTAAFFGQVGLKADPASEGKQIGGTAVEGAKPLYEEVFDRTDGEVMHERTGLVAAPVFPYEAAYDSADDMTRRQRFAAWMTSPDNRYFARGYVNRLWGYLMGVGLIEPIDDIRAGNPPSNPALLDHLTDQFIAGGFDTRKVIAAICKSRTYQLSFRTNKWNEDDRINFSHALPRRLPAEVLYDAVYASTGSVSKFPGLPDGLRAAELPDAGAGLDSGFLATFGRPSRESACECDRSNDVQLGSVMALISGPTVAEAIAQPGNAIEQLVQAEQDDAALFNRIFLRVLNRPATEAEVAAARSSMSTIESDHRLLEEALAERESWWAAEKPKLEEKRQASIAEAQHELEATKEKLKPVIAEREQQRQTLIAEREAALKQHEDSLAAALDTWSSKWDRSVDWAPLSPTAASADHGKAAFSIQPDRSILITKDEQGDGVYTVTTRTDLRNLRAIRLEVLTDPSIGGQGPGRMYGNFVLTELQVEVAPASNPEARTPVKLTTPLADFSQENFPVSFAVDGNTGNRDQGWALHPAVGVPHWATFQLEQPIDHEGGSIVTFRFHHRFNQKNFVAGRVRLSTASRTEPVGLSISEHLAASLSTPADSRTDDQNTSLAQYVRKTDNTWHQHVASLNEARQPLPEDPAVAAINQRLEYLNLPVADDPLLVQLRKDVDVSKSQIANVRLTAAQDLTWALINSPAFLFNH